MDDMQLSSVTYRRGFVEGFRLIEEPNLLDGPFEDWSRVRSPSRARRRRAKHRQNIRVYHTPSKNLLKLPNGDVVGHPATIRALERKLADQMTQRIDDMAAQIIRGSYTPAGLDAIYGKGG